LITQDSLILWGRNDRILEPSTAYSLNKEIKQNELVWIEDCGHVPHLEQPELTANYIVNFINKQNK
jgi:pimeloyl-ACP methyl ester carboxylesterase